MADVARSAGVGERLRRRWVALRDSRAVESFLAHRRNLLGLGIVAGLCAVAVVGPVILPRSPTETALTSTLEAPSMAHPFGTDELGRDLFTRMVYGARISLAIGALVTGVRLALGTLVGVVAGYAGGWVDEAAMRLVDVLLAFPGIVLALVIAGMLGPSLPNAMLGLAVVGWGRYARVVRSEVLSVTERGYVNAARLMGVSRPRLVVRHVLPNVLGPVVVLATLDIGTVVLGAAGLSFLGLGAQPPTPEWGTMLASGRNHLQQAWWLVNVPGVAIVVTVFGFNLLGDGLRDVLDPRQEATLQEVES
jgi:peptide/nickel transport system permease protein